MGTKAKSKASTDETVVTEEGAAKKTNCQDDNPEFLYIPVDNVVAADQVRSGIKLWFSGRNS
ncbi:MAG: hypothetical protein C0392_04620 [Syntrophus sp. (in: bacteria)]|nr:hypothetical protein [Syntrophus sp. (in: bacteria)]